MTARLPQAQHLRVLRTEADGAYLYTFTIDSGTAEYTCKRRLDRAQQTALINAIGNIATTLGAFADNPNAQPVAASLDAHARALTDQIIPPEVLELLNRRDEPLLISTTDPGFPFQLVMIGGTPLGLLRPFAVRVILENHYQPLQRPETLASTPRSALLIADPSGDHKAAHDEINALEASLLRLDPKMRIEKLTQARANLGEVQAQLSQPYDLAHYAGHIKWDDHHGGERGIVLWDGMLPLSAIHHTQHPDAAVFLNGCWGGAFKITLSPDTFQISRPTHPHERPVGFGVEFARAGARSFLAPLWPVYDHYASDFAQRVYRYLVAGESFGAALLRVRRDLRKERPTDPTWSVYVLYGHPAEPLFMSISASVATFANASDRAAQPATSAPDPQPAMAGSRQPSPGAMRNAASAPEAERIAALIERRCFREIRGSGMRFADDARAAVIRALDTLNAEYREALHSLDLFVAAYATFIEAGSDAAELLQGLAESPVIRDLERLWRGIVAPDTAASPPAAADLAYGAFKNHTLVLYGDERKNTSPDAVALSDQVVAAVEKGARLAEEVYRLEVTCGDLLEAMLSDPHGSINGALVLLQLDPSDTVRRLRSFRLASHEMDTLFASQNHDGVINTVASPGGQAGLAGGGALPLAPQSGVPSASAQPGPSIGLNMRTRASSQALRYVCGWSKRAEPDPRAEALRRLVSTLASAPAPHALVIGQRGAGVWALVEALAMALVARPSDPVVSPLTGLPMLALQLRSFQPTGPLEDRFVAFLSQGTASAPVILVVRNIETFLEDGGTRAQRLAALDAALATSWRRLALTTTDPERLATVMGGRIERLAKVELTPASFEDVKQMITGHVPWLSHDTGVLIPEDVALEAARETGPLAQPGLGIRLLADACAARLQSLSHQQGGDTIFTISSARTLSMSGSGGHSAFLTIQELQAAAQRLRSARGLDLHGL